MKTLQFSYIIIVAAALILFIRCSKDEDNGEEGTSLEGSYAITSAVLAAPLTLTTNEAGDITMPARTPITQQIQQALFSAVGCNVPENTLIDLRADHSLFMTCAGESTELNSGTWEAVSATVLRLNMNSAAIPSSPTGVVLEVTDLTVSGNTLSGETDVPLAKAMLADMIETLSEGAATLNLEATNDAVIASINISFTKQ